MKSILAHSWAPQGQVSVALPSCTVLSAGFRGPRLIPSAHTHAFSVLWALGRDDADLDLQLKGTEDLPPGDPERAPLWFPSPS